MKTLRFLMAALLLIVCGAFMKAQVVKFPEVKIYKAGNVIASFLPAQVDSVVYEMNEVDMSVDRNIYSDPNCTQKLFDSSKVIVGKTSIAGEPWEYYSQNVVTIPEGVDELDMKIDFVIYARGLGGNCEEWGDVKKDDTTGYYYESVGKGNVLIILAKQ